MRSGLDIDGVLYKFSHAAQYMMAKKKGLRDREDLVWDDSQWDCAQPPEDWDWVLSPEQVNYVFRHGHLWSGAVEFVYELAKLSEIVVITRRPKHAAKVTLDWIRYTFDHDPYPFSEVHILGDGQAKSDIPADVYIDDSLENIIELSENTSAELLLVDRPWNKGKLPPRAWRAMSFEDVLQEVKHVEYYSSKG